MKHLKELLLLAIACIMSLSAQAQTKIYGNVIYSDNNATPLGIYSFNAADGLTFEPVKVDEEMKATNGGVYENGKYHFMNMFTYYQYNAETWVQVKKESLGFMKGGPMQATALAYDDTTKKIYGCFMDYTTYSYVFGTVDYDKAERTAIKSLGDNIMRCMVCTPEGKIYGINGDGTLYSFDKTTGDISEVGSTGLSISNIQGAVCDPKDGKVYWAACLTNGKTGLYELDLETASAILVAEFPNNEEVTGLFILPTADPDATPKAATNLKSVFENGGLTGHFSFTMPTESNLDEKLNSDVDYKVTVDEKQLLTGSGKPGAEITTADVTLTRGFHNVSVVCSNASGESLATYDFPFIGKDTPKAVENLTLKKSGNKAMLSWDAVTTGVNGGYIGNMTYKVVRYPGETTVAEATTNNSFEETVNDADFSRIYYTVSPCNDGTEYGDTLASEPVTFGSVINPPYSEDFKTASAINDYKVIDADADGNTWEFEPYGKTVEVTNRAGSTNDWLISPAIKLSKDRMYKVTGKLTSQNVYVPQNYTFALLKSADGIGSPLKVIASGSVYNESKTITEFLNVETDGQYYIALHAATEASSCHMAISELAINEGTLLSAPGHVGELSIKAADKGELKASVSFNTPTKNLDGTAIESLSKIEVFRNSKLIKTINNIPASATTGNGMNISFDDNEAEQGMNAYSVIAYSAEKKGIETIAEKWVGFDSPKMPKNVVATLVDNGIKITWEPQTEGAHEGYVDQSGIRYMVVDGNANVALANGLTATTYTDKIETNGEQALMGYGIIAYNEIGQSDFGVSNGVLIGAPYNIPLTESFPSAATTYFWGIDGSSKAAFMLDNSTSSDLDGGCVSFTGSNDEATLYSGKLDLKGNEAVKLSFDYYCNTPQAATLEVKAYSPERGFKTLGTVDMSNFSNYRWQTAEFRLDEFMADKDVQVYFCGKSTAEAQKFFIDRIVIEPTKKGTDGISSAVDANTNVKQEKVYDIQGRKVNSLFRGELIISNGMKRVAK